MKNALKKHAKGATPKDSKSNASKGKTSKSGGAKLLRSKSKGATPVGPSKKSEENTRDVNKSKAKKAAASKSKDKLAPLSEAVKNKVSKRLSAKEKKAEPMGVDKNHSHRKSLRVFTPEQGDAVPFPYWRVFAVMCLWMSCIGSAMGVIYSTYHARQSVQELELLKREASGLRVMSGQYLLEKSSWAAYSRVEQIALTKLDMQVPASDKTKLVYRE